MLKKVSAGVSISVQSHLIEHYKLIIILQSDKRQAVHFFPLFVAVNLTAEEKLLAIIST